MRARQWRDGSKVHVLAQLFNWTELKCTRRKDSTHLGCFPGDARITTIALRHVPFFSVVLWRAVQDKPCGSGGSRLQTSSSTTTKPSHAYALRRSGKLCTCGVIAMVTGDGEMISNTFWCQTPLSPASRRQRIHKIRRKLTSPNL